MCEIMDELIEKEIKDTKVNDIKSLMSKLNLGVEKAMECLSIPKEDYPIYLKLLSQE